MYTDYTEENTNEEESSYFEENKEYKNGLPKIILWIIGIIIIIILCLILFKACSNNNNHNNEGNNAIVAISRENVAIGVGDKYQLYADVLMTDNNNPKVIWISEDSSIVSVDSEGLIEGISVGETKVIATYVENGEKVESSCSVVVTDDEIKIENINIVQQQIKIRKGLGSLLQISVTPSGAKTDTLVYSSDNSSIASVDNTGYIKANAVGVTTIRVKTKDGLIGDSVSVIVEESGSYIINPTALKITAPSSSLKIGERLTISAEVSPSNATDKTVKWQSSDPSIASVSNGVVSGIKAGTVTITVTTSNGISQKMTITVVSNTINVSGIKINNGTSYQMEINDTKKISYTVLPENATNKKVTFLSNNPSVAKVDSTGLVTALSAGNATITVKTENGGKTATINVTVNKPVCTVDNMITIKATTNHIYTDGSANMTPVSGDVIVTVEDIKSCISSMRYAVANSGDGAQTVTEGSQIRLNRPGINKLGFEGTTTDGVKFTKIYYVLIENGTGSSGGSSGGSSSGGSTSGGSSELLDPITLKFKLISSTNATAVIKVDVDDLYGLKSIKYCRSTATGTCNYSYSFSNLDEGDKTASETITAYMGGKLCVEATNIKNQIATSCFTVKESNFNFLF